MHYFPYRHGVQQKTAIRILTVPVDCISMLQDMCDVKSVAYFFYPQTTASLLTQEASEHPCNVEPTRSTAPARSY